MLSAVPITSQLNPTRGDHCGFPLGTLLVSRGKVALVASVTFCGAAERKGVSTRMPGVIDRFFITDHSSCR